MTTIQTIAWKDIREHLRPALLLTLVLTGIMAYMAFGGRTSPASIDSFTMIACFGYPIAGAALGFLVLIFESRGDRWAFLAHRPVPAASIFWGKLLAAVALYLLATLPEGIGVWVWLSRPGNLGMPFLWVLSLPSIAAWTVGLCCIPAGMMVAVRGARWYGSRIFPLAFVLAPALGAISLWEFWQVAISSAVSFVVITLAARPVFAAGLESARLRGAGKLLTATVMLPSIVLLIGMMIAIASTLVSKPYQYNYKTLLFLDDGRAVIQTGTQYSISLQNLDGSVTPDLENLQSWDAIQSRTAESTYVWSAQLPLRWNPRPRYHEIRRCFTRVENRYTTDVQWFFRPDLMLLEGYSLIDRTLVGWIGPDGFAPPPIPPGTRFSGELRWAGDGDAQSFLVLSSAAYRVNFLKRTISMPLYTAEEGEEIINVTPWAGDDEPGPQKSARTQRRYDTAIATNMKFLNLDQENRETLRFTFPETLKQPLTFITLYHFKNPRRFALSTTVLMGSETRLYDLDPSTGKLGDPKVFVPPKQMPISMSTPQQIVGGTLVGPLAGGFFTVMASLEKQNRAMLQMRPQESDPMKAAYFGFAISAALGGVGCFLAGRRARLERGKLALWTALGFIGGVGGVLLMLCVEQFPTLVACPACGRRRALTRDACEHCGAAFTPPAKDGSEIFEALTTSSGPAGVP